MTIVVGKEVDLANPRQHFMDFNAIYMLECEIGLKPFEFFSSAGYRTTQKLSQGWLKNRGRSGTEEQHKRGVALMDLSGSLFLNLTILFNH